MSDNKEKIDWNKREIGALWKKAKGTQQFYSGKISLEGKDYEIECFTNKFKKADNHPDGRVYLSADHEPTNSPII